MPQRALIDKRPWLVASLIAGISYYFVRGDMLPDIYEWALKGAGVALLAAYALSRHKGADSRQIAAVMGFGALGDVLIELQLEWGAAAFLMIEFLNVSYQTIIAAAMIPAFMHFFGVFMQVHFEAKRYGLRGLTDEEMPRLKDSLRSAGPR